MKWIRFCGYTTVCMCVYGDIWGGVYVYVEVSRRHINPQHLWGGGRRVNLHGNVQDVLIFHSAPTRRQISTNKTHPQISVERHCCSPAPEATALNRTKHTWTWESTNHHTSPAPYPSHSLILSDRIGLELVDTGLTSIAVHYTYKVGIGYIPQMNMKAG